MVASVILILILGYIEHCKAGTGQVHWDYNTQGDSGPSHWSKKFEHCSGTRQSPVDLKSAHKVNYSPLQLDHYDTQPVKSHLENNGHTMKLTTTAASTDLVPTLYGGGLTEKYTFSQVHFHWGSKDGQGSEHQVEGKSYPVEMHLVHYKASLPNITTALVEGAGDNLAALGVFFQVTDKPNPGFTQLLPRMSEVKLARSKILDAPLVSLASLLDSADLSSFYRYNGSLTTPKCDEIVQWTVLSNPVTITSDQLQALRDLKDGFSRPLVDNYRPVQSLGDRKVLAVNTKTPIPSQKIHTYRGTDSGAGPRTVSVLMVALILGVTRIL